MTAAPLSPWTVVVTGPNRQEVVRSALRVGLPITIGRAPDCTITLPAMPVARYHGRIELSASGVLTYVADPNAPAQVDGDPVEGATQLGERTLLEIANYSITLVRNRPATTSAPKPAAPASEPSPAGPDSETLLDRHIQGVRLHRNTHQQEHQLNAQKWQEDWRKAVVQLRAIKARYGNHPSILDFAISKDESEAIVKLKDAGPRGYVYFVLSRAHPEGKFQNVQAVWVREVGRGDESFPEPLKGLENMLARIASRLA